MLHLPYVRLGSEQDYPSHGPRTLDDPDWLNANFSFGCGIANGLGLTIRQGAFGPGQQHVVDVHSIVAVMASYAPDRIDNAQTLTVMPDEMAHH